MYMQHKLIFVGYSLFVRELDAKKPQKPKRKSVNYIFTWWKSVFASKNFQKLFISDQYIQFSFPANFETYIFPALWLL